MSPNNNPQTPRPPFHPVAHPAPVQHHDLTVRFEPSQTIHLNFNGAFEVRRYPSLDDPSVYSREIYRIGAILSDKNGVLVLALERKAEDGRTEVLQIRMLTDPT